MEWVETTGRTIDEAKEAALDELGVDESDAEFEVLEEARAGLFGRLRSEARVRARVRPTAPRAKEDRRDRRRRATDRGSDTAAASRARERRIDQPGRRMGTAKPRRRLGHSRRGGGAADRWRRAAPGPRPQNATPERVVAARAAVLAVEVDGPRPETSAQAKGAGSAEGDQDSEPREGANVEVALDEQGRIAQEFLTGLVAEFGSAGGRADCPTR